MNGIRKFNARGKYTLTSFILPWDVVKWRCLNCNCKLRRGICGPGTKQIDEGSLVPCPYCFEVFSLTYGFRLREPTTLELFDFYTFCEELADTFILDNEENGDIDG